MEFIFKKGDVVLEILTEEEAEEREEAIQEKYANENFKSLEIQFLDDTKYNDVNDVVEYIFQNNIKNLTFNFK